MYFLAVLGLCCSSGLFSTCDGNSLVAVQSSHCQGFFYFRAEAPGHTGFSSCGMWVKSCGSQALEHRLISYGAQA